MNDPAASFWLKQAIRAALDRDPVDALQDAIALTRVLSGRLDDLTTRQLTSGY